MIILDIEIVLLIIGLGILCTILWLIKFIDKCEQKEPELNLKEICIPEKESKTYQVKQEADSKTEYNECPCQWERPDICRHCDIKNKD